jgi:hypothetical protein
MSKPEISERKRNANRANALKSTGPRTEAGKARSRFNAVTHGMRAETVVLPHEDAAAFEAERLGWIEDWKPETQTRMALVERAAAQSWRLRRCVRVETARLTMITNQAAANYDRTLNARLMRGLRLLETSPEAGLEALGDDPDGIEVLIGAWSALGKAVAATPLGWNDFHAHHGRLMNLLGHPATVDPEDVGPGAQASFKLLRSNIGDLPEEERVDATEAKSIADGLLYLVRKRTDALIFKLSDYVDPVALRTREIESVCFDHSPEGLALHRYEATHDRAFKATVSQLMQMAKTGSDLIATNEATDDADHCNNEVCETSEPPQSDPKPPRAPRPTADAPNEPTDEPGRTTDRDREGRVWGVEETDPTLIDR